MAAQPHPRYYIPSGTDVFRVDDTLYKIHRDQISAISPVFSDMFLSGVPRPGSGGIMDGATDADPIVLTGCKASEFEHLLSWMYPAFADPSAARDPDRFVSILKLAHLWEMSTAKTFAMKEIENESWLDDHDVRLIGLAFKYQISSWFSEAFRSLVRRRVTNYTVAETEMVGLRTMMALMKTQDAMEQHRKLLAYFPPPIQHTRFCVGLSRSSCKSAYEDLWWKYIAKALLDPAAPASCWSVPSAMEKINAVGMGDGCLEKTRIWLSGHPVLKMEDKIVEGSIGQLIQAAGLE